MKNITLNKKDIIEIEDMKENVESLIIKEIKRTKFATSKMLQNNCQISLMTLRNSIRTLRTEGVIEAKRMLVKYKGAKNYVSVLGYVFTEQ